jgi:hypothetical protein
MSSENLQTLFVNFRKNGGIFKMAWENFWKLLEIFWKPSATFQKTSENLWML